MCVSVTILIQIYCAAPHTASIKRNYKQKTYKTIHGKRTHLFTLKTYHQHALTPAEELKCVAISLQATICSRFLLITKRSYLSIFDLIWIIHIFLNSSLFFNPANELGDSCVDARFISAGAAFPPTYHTC